MADIDTSAEAVEILVSFPLPKPNLSRRIWQPVTENMRQPNENTAMRLAPLSWQPSGAHHALEHLSQLEEALSRDLEAMRAELHLMKTAGIVEVAIRNPSVAEYMFHWETRAEKAEAERDAALAREQAFRAVLEGAGYQDIDSITTPEYGKALGEMVAARTKEIIFDYTAALAREQALLEGKAIWTQPI